MSEPISRCPFQKFDLSNSLGAQPHALSHLLSREFVAPTGFVRVRQVGEGHRARGEMTDSLEDLSARRGNKAVADASDIHQIFSLIIADDQRIESVWPRNVSANHQLLSTVRPAFDPSTASFPCFVQAVFAFRYDAL